jgi:hypothetical protein
MTKKELKKENKLLLELLEESSRGHKHKDSIIDMLQRQIEIQDKAIERKDRQFFGLKEAYKDDLINGMA